MMGVFPPFQNTRLAVDVMAQRLGSVVVECVLDPPMHAAEMWRTRMLFAASNDTVPVPAHIDLRIPHL